MNNTQLIIGALFDPKTGIYKNNRMCRYEAWLINTDKQFAKMIGWLTFDAVARGSDLGEEYIFSEWEKMIWKEAINLTKR